MNKDVAVLMTHKENLENASSFEEYKAAHIAYVEYLIERNIAKEQLDNAAYEFATKTSYALKKE